MVKYYLKPKYQHQKSFNKLAQIIELDNGDKLLKSYTTIVCGIIDGKFKKFWADYSATTMKHINEFSYQFGDGSVGKKWWINIPAVNNPYPEFDGDGTDWEYHLQGVEQRRRWIEYVDSIGQDRI